MNTRNAIVIFITLNILLALASCSTKSPDLKNPNNGIAALSCYASNTSRMDFYRYYKVFPSTNPDLAIVIFPKRGNNYGFSPELSPGNYNFDKIKIILESNIARSSLHSWVEDIPGGINVEINPGMITLAEKRLVIDQYDMRGSTSVNIEMYFQSLAEDEIKMIEKDFQSNLDK